MRVLASILLAFCLVSFSALASYGKTNAVHAVYISAETVQLSNDAAIESSVQISDQTLDDAGRDCRCKKDSGSLSLTCGVTLALSDESGCGHLLVVKRAWFAFEANDRDPGMMYLLRRPPRDVL